MVTCALMGKDPVVIQTLFITFLDPVLYLKCGLKANIYVKLYILLK